MAERVVTIASFSTPLEANMARNRLEAEGIPTFLEDVETVGMAWHLGQAVGGVKIQVPPEYMERAHLVLRDMAGPVTKQDKSSGEAQSRYAFRVAALGFIFPPLQLYSMWILGRLLVTRHRLGKEDKRRLVWTAVLNLWFVLFALAIVFLVME